MKSNIIDLAAATTITQKELCKRWRHANGAMCSIRTVRRRLAGLVPVGFDGRMNVYAIQQIIELENRLHNARLANRGYKIAARRIPTTEEVLRAAGRKPKSKRAAGRGRK